MLTRWAVKPSDEFSQPCDKRSTLMMAPITLSLSEEFDWPSLREINDSQENHKSKKPQNRKYNNGLLRFDDNSLWVPERDHSLQIRLMIAAHTGSAGHRGFEPTISTITKYFKWKSVREFIKKLLNRCIHCLSTSDGEIIQRLLGNTLHHSKPNLIIHFDYCYM